MDRRITHVRVSWSAAIAMMGWICAPGWLAWRGIGRLLSQVQTSPTGSRQPPCYIRVIVHAHSCGVNPIPELVDGDALDGTGQQDRTPGAEVVVIVFDIGRPMLRDSPFNAGPCRPAGPRDRCTWIGQNADHRTDERVVDLLASPGRATPHIDQPAFGIGVAEPRGGRGDLRSEPREDVERTINAAALTGGSS
jgi:hypothetical protein